MLRVIVEQALESATRARSRLRRDRFDLRQARFLDIWPSTEPEKVSN
jgi:hypothetical protein